MPKSPNFRFFQGGLIKHRTTPKFFTTQYDYMVLIALSGFVGATVGLVIAMFEELINWVGDFRIHLVESASLSPFLSIIAGASIGALITALGFWLTARFAPEASGSGIPHLEGALDGLHDIRWRRVLPIKFFAGALTISSGMVLGREGPSIQIGGSVGRMFAGRAKRYQHATHILTAAGAAAGLAAAFNAPLAGVLFVIEEMRPQFRYSITSFKCVTLSSAAATIVMRSIHGQSAVMDIPNFSIPALNSLWLFALLGIIFGIVGVNFNRWVLSTTAKVQQLQKNRISRIVMTGAAFGAVFATLQSLVPDITGGGVELITELFRNPIVWGVCLLLFVLRLFTTIASFGSAAPGGVFSPMLALGTLLGLAYGSLMASYFPDLVPEPGIFAIAGMGALFAATVRAPVTGIILVVEMTDNYQLILPLLVTCLGATFIAQALKGKSLYSELLKQSLRNNPEIKRQINESHEDSKTS
ncbi:H(+)/Cl(-) exchange transporter ClcA [Agarivorans sp. QJM3NY_33]|uniref:H(+)/Cl(-) exchange transporter ClcA n=1 Tax=Agarivorans sp. QJM3NY_33 TaxID=3421432 RepID=UPI003D7D8418